ncbi:Anti-sigma K factor RskA [Segniliparus rotundus DSM 44985]|uniref:Regulator of SigK n=1 Tax=Segniliparus rotundus (strain ATCC BAA-972 / CDC 1076 / CIP 108378 / DSM 44985 / JCM 13578) TaxID=640132 RepID=D6Z9I8_SEGRD|nr:anti-sigma factor [Segniliparus rotundus]ADG96515.1 Anti-sigma K factor RskA [Segniliparus rotundus DSM 44985]
MSRPGEPPAGLLGLAAPYALHAVSDTERAAIERALREADPAEAQAFRNEVRRIHETMADVAALTAVEPPERLKARIVAATAQTRPKWFQRTSLRVAAVAATLLVGLAAGAGWMLLGRSPAPPSAAARILAAPDVRAVSGAIPGGGTATVVFSPELHKAVLVMNDVAPPRPGTVYELWLVGPNGPEPAGTMDAHAISPSTTAVIDNLGDSTVVGLSVEPPGGSRKPTGAMFAELRLA